MRALKDMDTLNVNARLRIDAARAIAHARLGARDSARAVELLDDAIQHMIFLNAEGVGTVGSDPFLLPLRRYAPFRALLKPAASDGVR